MTCPEQKDLSPEAVHVPQEPLAATLSPAYSQVPSTNILGGVALTSSSCNTPIQPGNRLNLDVINQKAIHWIT